MEAAAIWGYEISNVLNEIKQQMDWMKLNA